jgi:hypothetical protein
MGEEKIVSLRAIANLAEKGNGLQKGKDATSMKSVNTVRKKGCSTTCSSRSTIDGARKKGNIISKRYIHMQTESRI